MKSSKSALDSSSNIPLPFSLSMTGGSIARARPRSITPTPATSYYSSHINIPTTILDAARKVSLLCPLISITVKLFLEQLYVIIMNSNLQKKDNK